MTEKPLTSDGAVATEKSRSDGEKRAAPDRDNNFNFIRLLFAALVIVFHSPSLTIIPDAPDPVTAAFPALTLGDICVNGFFLLSGYLIVQSWDRGPVLADFLKKRILRIYPGFIVASLISALIVGPLGSDAREYFAQFHWANFVKGLFILKSTFTPPVFAGTPHPSVNASMWTIEHEFRCYMVVALLGVMGLVKNRYAWFAVFLFALITYSAPHLISPQHFPGRRILLGEGGF